MLQRTLVYTAMSRAAQLLVLVAAPAALAQGVANVDPQRRLTNLPPRVRNHVARAAASAAAPAVAEDTAASKLATPEEPAGAAGVELAQDNPALRFAAEVPF